MKKSKSGGKGSKFLRPEQEDDQNKANEGRHGNILQNYFGCQITIVEMVINAPENIKDGHQNNVGDLGCHIKVKIEQPAETQDKNHCQKQKINPVPDNMMCFLHRLKDQTAADNV